jgi:hypothetical protein
LRWPEVMDGNHHRSQHRHVNHSPKVEKREGKVCQAA